jgi:hypothetical protein
MLDQQREVDEAEVSSTFWLPRTVTREREVELALLGVQSWVTGRTGQVRGKEWDALRVVWWNEREWGGFYSRGELGWMPWAAAVANPWSRADVREVAADEGGQTSAEWGFWRVLGLAGWARPFGPRVGNGVTANVTSFHRMGAAGSWAGRGEWPGWVWALKESSLHWFGSCGKGSRSTRWWGTRLGRGLHDLIQKLCLGRPFLSSKTLPKTLHQRGCKDAQNKERDMT